MEQTVVLLRVARAAGTDLGRRASEYMDRGDLVPDELIVAMIQDAIAGFASTRAKRLVTPLAANRGCSPSAPVLPALV